MNCLFNYGFKEAFLATLLRFLNVLRGRPKRRGADLGQVFAFMIRHDAGKQSSEDNRTDRQRVMCETPPLLLSKQGGVCRACCAYDQICRQMLLRVRRLATLPTH